MIDAKTAFEYAQQLEEYVKAGNTIEQICACNDRKQVMRFSYHLMQNPPMPVSEEQIDKSLLNLEEQKVKLEEQKVVVLEEKEKIVVEEKEEVVVGEVGIVE
jgi:hypothetical protein